MRCAATGDFCACGMACVEAALREGCRLVAYHPSTEWLGTCTAPPPHTAVCAAFFNGHVFRAPHAMAVAHLAASTCASEAEFAAATRTADEALMFAASRPVRAHVWVSRALEVLGRGGDRPCAATLRLYLGSGSPSRAVLAAAWPPPPGPDIGDAAWCAAYVGFTRGVSGMRRGHHGPTDAAVDAVLARLPHELSTVVGGFVYQRD